MLLYKIFLVKIRRICLWLEQSIVPIVNAWSRQQKKSIGLLLFSCLVGFGISPSICLRQKNALFVRANACQKRKQKERG